MTDRGQGSSSQLSSGSPSLEKGSSCKTLARVDEDQRLTKDKGKLRLCALASRPNRGALLVKDDERLVLPFLYDRDINQEREEDFDKFISALKAKCDLNFEMRRLRSIYEASGDSWSLDFLEGRPTREIHLPEGAECKTMDEILEMGRPLKADKILKYVPERLLEALEGWEADNRRAFSLRGEACSAVSWMMDAPRAKRQEVIGRVSQHQVRGESSIFRAKSRNDCYFLKAAPIKPWRANEASITERVSRLLPEFVARPVAVSNSRRWALTKDFGKPIALAPKGRDRAQQEKSSLTCLPSFIVALKIRQGSFLAVDWRSAARNG